MFNKLMASASAERSFLKNPTVVFASIAFHLLALAGLVWATREAEAVVDEPELEQITYIDITELPPPEPEQVFEAAPEPPAAETPPAPTALPPRPAPARAPAQPRAPAPDAPATEEAAGFQELSVPDVDVSGIPPPDVAAPPVRAEDFGGRGAAGGTAAGTRPPAPATTPRGTGTGSGTGEGGGGNRTYSANLVDEQAELVNRGDVARILSRRYPPQLRDAGVTGRVVVQFVVDRNGRVEPGSVQIVSTSQDAFAAATREALQEFRFRPGKVRGQPVRQLVQIPVTWTLQR